MATSAAGSIALRVDRYPFDAADVAVGTVDGGTGSAPTGNGSTGSGSDLYTVNRKWADRK